jgi:hypothetical protein
MRLMHVGALVVVVGAIAATAGATVPIARNNGTTTVFANVVTTRKPVAAVALTASERSALIADILAQTHALPPPPLPNLAHLPNPFTISSATLAASNPGILVFDIRHPLDIFGANGAASAIAFPGAPHPTEPQISVAWASLPNALYMVDCTVSDRASGVTISEVDWAGGQLPAIAYANATHIAFASAAIASTPGHWASNLAFNAIAGFHLTADKDWTLTSCEITMVGTLPP